jgi:hypothetical protein
MVRLIDADALAQRMEKRYADLWTEYGQYNSYVAGFDEATMAVEAAPTVDAVEVVRCRECKHWIKIGAEFLIAKIYGECRLLGDDDTRYADDYCSDGERRDTDEQA